MLFNYLKTAWRNLWSHKLFTIINIVSLAIGLSAAFVIGILVYYDFTFDKFHKDSDRIYRITSYFKTPSNTFHNRGVPVPLASSVQKEVSGIEVASYFYNTSFSSVNIPGKEAKFRSIRNVVYTDQSYFQLFNYTWLAGSSSGILQQPNEVILTQQRAQKYFPNTPLNEIVGKRLIYNDSIVANITGIVANFKQRSDLIFEEFLSLQTAIQVGKKNQVLSEAWDGTNSASQLFIKLDKNTDISALQNQLDVIAASNINPKLAVYDQTQHFYIQPLQELHFDQTYGVFDASTAIANKSSLWGLSGIALFILILGCINFINLNTAQATKRAKEIGVRKTLGASKKQIIFQVFGEMLLLTMLATLLSIGVSAGLLDIFSDFIPQGVAFKLFATPQILGLIIFTLIIVTLLSGLYPALIVSNFNPLSILKRQATSSKQTVSLRRYLTIFQFTIAQIFILGTLLVGKQLHFLMNKDIGFKTDAIAYINIPWSDLSITKSTQLASTLESIPQIDKVSLGYHPPASFNSSFSHLVYQTNTQEIRTDVQILFGDTHYLDLYNIDLLAGRHRLNDTIAEYVINEAYLKKLGFNHPDEAIGTFVKNEDGHIPIVGVVKDFNQHSLKYQVSPMAITGDLYRSEFPQFRMLHFSLQHTDRSSWEDAFAKAETSFKNIYPNAIFNLRFVDETIKSFYTQERKTATLLNWAMGLSIIISCLGLFALVIHTMHTRKKEIGIRKVLGQKSKQITLLLSKEFMKLVAISVIIGMPLAYIFFKDWLSDFSYQVPLKISYFILAGGLTFIVALVTVSGQTIVASRRNPIDTLKEE